MSFKKSLVLVSILLGFSLYSHASLAKPGKGHFKKMFKELDLTPEQQEKMKELRKNKPNQKANFKEMKELKKQFKEALGSDASESELKKLHSQIQEKKAAMAKQGFEQMLKIRAILTPEQRKKFKDMRHEGGKGKRGWDNH